MNIQRPSSGLQREEPTAPRRAETGKRRRRSSNSSELKTRAPSGSKSLRGWTVVDQFVRDGFFYRLVRRPIAEEVRAVRLTRREQQALAYAEDGHTNKSIAYALGLAPSTVGVLLFRAAAKMGVKSRRELLLAYSRLKQQTQAAGGAPGQP